MEKMELIGVCAMNTARAKCVVDAFDKIRYREAALVKKANDQERDLEGMREYVSALEKKNEEHRRNITTLVSENNRLLRERVDRCEEHDRLHFEVQRLVKEKSALVCEKLAAIRSADTLRALRQKEAKRDAERMASMRAQFDRRERLSDETIVRIADERDEARAKVKKLQKELDEPGRNLWRDGAMRVRTTNHAFPLVDVELPLTYGCSL